MLADAAETLGGGREGALCREITKKFEEVRRGSLSALAHSVTDSPVKGEIVVLIGRGSSQTVSDSDVETDLKAALKTMSVKDAADAVSQAHGLARRKIYQLALKLGKDDV